MSCLVTVADGSVSKFSFKFRTYLSVHELILWWRIKTVMIFFFCREQHEIGFDCDLNITFPSGMFYNESNPNELHSKYPLY